MSIGNKILLEGSPKGKHLEGIISGTPKPGTCMEVKQTNTLVGGQPTWQAWSKSTGAYGMVAVLLEDRLQGGDETAAYVSGSRGFLYCPLAGEAMNMRVANQSGTAEDANIGDLFAITTTTGLLIHNSANVFPCFTAIEDKPSAGGEYLLGCLFNG